MPLLMDSITSNSLMQLVLRAQQGSEQAVEELFLSLIPSLRASVRSSMRKDLRPLVDVDDISQAMALRILRLLPDLNYMGRRPFRTWLRKLVVREIQKSADQLFAKKRDLRQSISLDELLKSGLYDDLPADDLVHKCRSIASSVAEIEQQRLLVLAIDELDSQTAELVRMVKLEGTTLREAATELQISESAAGKRMAKGLADLSYKMQSLFRDR